MPNTNTFRVKNWPTLYENNRTKELKNLSWLPLPNRQDSDGYTLLVDRKNGAALFGAWVAVLQVASKCDPRGTLLRDGATPHDSASLSRITRIPKEIIDDMISICLNDCKWLEIIDLQQGAVIPQDDAAASHLARARGMEGKGTEGKGTEGKEYHSDARAVIHFLNEQAGVHYRETDSNLKFISARLSESEVDFEGVKKMIVRQCQLWKGSDMEKYLRPETLFNATKFDGYYAAKDLPIKIYDTHQPTPKGNRKLTPSEERNQYGPQTPNPKREAFLAHLSKHGSGVPFVYKPEGT